MGDSQIHRMMTDRPEQWRKAARVYNWLLGEYEWLDSAGDPIDAEYAAKAEDAHNSANAEAAEARPAL